MIFNWGGLSFDICVHAEASITPTTMALPPPPIFTSSLPLFLPPPQTIFGHCIRNFVQFMPCVFFGEFWKLAVRDNDNKKAVLSQR